MNVEEEIRRLQFRVKKLEDGILTVSMVAIILGITTILLGLRG